MQTARLTRFGWVMAVAAAVRLPALALAWEHYGDAPVRIELAERWARAPHLWRGFLETYQYGPLHLTLIGALVRLLGDRVAAARTLSLVGGLLGVALIWALARRIRGEGAAFWAGLGLALSPLHIQASTTGASEAPFLALLLGALACALDRRALASALLLGAAGLVRYDGWMYLPLFAALLWLRERDLPKTAGFLLVAGAPAAFWLWVNHRYAGDALAPIRHIDRDHRQLAEMMLVWFGQVRWRLYGLSYWPIAVCAVVTPLLAVFALWGSLRTLLRRAAGWEIVALAWLPAAYLTFRTVVLADFRPMARFAMVPAALSLLFAHDALERLGKWARPATLAVLIATPLALFAASWNRNGGLAEWSRPLSPVSSLAPGFAQTARWLKANARPDEVVLLDTVWHYADIPIAFAVNWPEDRWLRVRWKDDFEQRFARKAPALAVVIGQGTLGDPSAARFEFRGLKFCEAARFVYATIYRRCD